MRLLRIVINLILLAFIGYMGMQFYGKYAALQQQASAIESDAAAMDEVDEELEQIKADLIAQSARLANLPAEKTIRDPSEIPGKVIDGYFIYKYAGYLPRNYGREKDRKYPLILFLHGQGAKGSDLNPLYSSGIIQTMLRVDDNNFIVVCPLCPADGGWLSHTLNRFLKQICEKYPVDKSRIYLTGISMGGHGSYQFACDYPQNFAAVAPVCGAGSTRKARGSLRHLPIWIFHGAQDEIVPVSRSYQMIHALESVGAPVKYTIFPDMGHNIGGVYEHRDLYAWFLQHKRNDR